MTRVQFFRNEEMLVSIQSRAQRVALENHHDRYITPLHAEVGDLEA